MYRQSVTTEAEAEAAMVTDGYPQPSAGAVARVGSIGSAGFPALPPYTPRPSAHRYMMEGHGNESNEMRLSEYVKGQTRAQDMKDAGGGF